MRYGVPATVPLAEGRLPCNLGSLPQSADRRLLSDVGTHPIFRGQPVLLYDPGIKSQFPGFFLSFAALLGGRAQSTKNRRLSIAQRQGPGDGRSGGTQSPFM